MLKIISSFFLLPIFTTMGWFFLGDDFFISRDWGGRIIAFFLCAPVLVISFFIRKDLNKFFFERKRLKKTWINERRVLGLSILISIFYVLLISFFYFRLIKKYLLS